MTGSTPPGASIESARALGRYDEQLLTGSAARSPGQHPESIRCNTPHFSCPLGMTVPIVPAQRCATPPRHSVTPLPSCIPPTDRLTVACWSEWMSPLTRGSAIPISRGLGGDGDVPAISRPGRLGPCLRDLALPNPSRCEVDVGAGTLASSGIVSGDVPKVPRTTTRPFFQHDAGPDFHSKCPGSPVMELGSGDPIDGMGLSMIDRGDCGLGQAVQHNQIC